MSPFEYVRATQLATALDAASRYPLAQFVAGGTNLLDLMKINVMQPAQLIDISALPLQQIDRTPTGVRIGALVKMRDVALHPLIVRDYSAVSQALLASASPQLRNMATIGGNVLQKTRCSYFRDASMPCNKRVPGSGCAAIAGDNRLHAVLGTSDACIATHASDLAVALTALDASLQLHGSQGLRSVPIDAFYRLPGTTPQRENVLQHGELIVAIDLPESPAARQSCYVKVRDRAAFEFALTAAAVGLEMSQGMIRQARVALGGVGTKPWRSAPAEAVLTGKPATPTLFREAAQRALQDARPQRHNAFKVVLAQRTLMRALQIASGTEEPA